MSKFLGKLVVAGVAGSVVFTTAVVTGSGLVTFAVAVVVANAISNAMEWWQGGYSNGRA